MSRRVHVAVVAATAPLPPSSQLRRGGDRSVGNDKLLPFGRWDLLTLLQERVQCFLILRNLGLEGRRPFQILYFLPSHTAQEGGRKSKLKHTQFEAKDSCQDDYSLSQNGYGGVSFCLI